MASLGGSACLGHKRLKIIDLSDNAAQPMSTPDGRYTIVYNGEVYNYREVAGRLRDRQYRSSGDTEVVLKAYAELGSECVQYFVGMFAFAIWDAHRNELFCCRDRLGIKPFYYVHHEGSFYFASEPAALFESGIDRRPNERVMYDFLARDYYEHDEDSFFEGIRKLAPGSCFYTNGARVYGEQRYWNVGESVGVVEVPRSKADRAAALLARMREAVELHRISDVPVGITLSGGLDSATLLSLVDEQSDAQQETDAYCFAFDNPSFSELRYTRRMAEHTGHDVHVEMVDEDVFIDCVESHAHTQQEPFAGLPILAYAKCFERARRRGAVVLLDGTGVDEGLAGYRRFFPAYCVDLFLEGRHELLEREMSAAGCKTRSQRKQLLTAMLASTTPHGDVGKGQDLSSSVRPDCLSVDFRRAWEERWPEFENPFNSCLGNLMHRELRYTKLPRALRFRDRLSMAVSSELRPPFLDHRLLEYELALPASDKIQGGVHKYLLRKAVRGLVPDDLRLAQKRSVQTPQVEWFRGKLREWVMDRLSCSQLWQTGWVDRNAALKATEAFLRGEGDNSFFVWQWINVDMWMRMFIESSLEKRSASG